MARGRTVVRDYGPESEGPRVRTDIGSFGVLRGPGAQTNNSDLRGNLLRTGISSKLAPVFADIDVDCQGHQ